MKNCKFFSCLLPFLAVFGSSCRALTLSELLEGSAVRRDSSSCRTISQLQQPKFQADHRDFAVKLYKIALDKSDNQNLIFSPSSISTVMGMLFEGSQFKTRSEIKRQFLKSVQRHHVKRGYNWLTQELNSEEKQYELHNSNAVFVDSSMSIRQKFMNTIRNCFQSTVENKDFKNYPDQSRQEVNQWVENRTNDKIQDLIPQNGVTSLTRMILVNAIYFKGDWLIPFDTKNGATTSKGRFYPQHRNWDRFQEVQMMSQKKNAYFYETSNMQVLGLPYKQNQLTMFLVMPKADSELNLADFESQQLTGNYLKTLMDQTESEDQLQQIQVSIPKFKMSHEVPLVEVLKNAGIRTMFKDGEADFGRINSQIPLYVSAAFHKAVIEVNEKGTEAAAATAAVLSTRSGWRTRSFTANRPFIYLIRHNSSDNILFMGRFSDAQGLDEQENS